MQSSTASTTEVAALGKWWPREAVGAIRLGITVVAALYLAMALELARPEWAGWTVLSVSLTTRASSLEKAAWRILGTIVGAVASLALEAAFAQDILAFDIALALWLGMATFLSSTARRQDAYGFALIGFTVPIVALSDVTQPLSLFATAVDRCSSLFLGIGCAYVAGAFAADDLRTVRAAVATRMERATRACADWWRTGQADGVWGEPPIDPVLSLDQSVMDAFTEQPSLRVGADPIAAAAPALLCILAAGLLLARLSSRRTASRTTGADDLGVSADAMLSLGSRSIDVRLRQNSAMSRLLRRGRRAGRRRAPARPLAFDRDWRLAGNNALRTMSAVSLVNAFWYVSDWSTGGTAVTWAALVSLLLCARQNQTQAAFEFFLGAALAEIIGLVAHYTVLTATPGFPLLAAVALTIGIYGAAGRADKRATSAGGFGIVVFTALEPLNVMQYDVAASLNGALATLLGVGTAVIAFASLPPPASDATRRLRARRRIAAALRAAAGLPAFLLPHSGRWCSPMFERARLLEPDGRAAVDDAHTLMLAGLLVLALRRDDDPLGRQAGRLITSGSANPAGKLDAYADGCENPLQRARLRALATLFAAGVSSGFPGLPPSGEDA